uniref:Uncharacterized protein n=1 Tax=Trichogramma kaykai TaxID=54128 RepID=A0ABD2WXL4_9HYME
MTWLMATIANSIITVIIILISWTAIVIEIAIVIFVINFVSKISKFKTTANIVTRLLTPSATCFIYVIYRNDFWPFRPILIAFG